MNSLSSTVASVTLPPGGTLASGTPALHVFAVATSNGGATEGPYGETAAVIPGTVQAANYDTGGQGVAYNVTSVNGSADSYRPDGVDLEACSDTGCGDDLRLADLDDGDGHRQAAGRSPDADGGPGQRRLEPALHGLRRQLSTAFLALANPTPKSPFGYLLVAVAFSAIIAKNDTATRE